MPQYFYSIKKVSATLLFYFKLAINRSVLSVFMNLHFPDSVCLYSMDFVSVTKPLKKSNKYPKKYVILQLI